MHGTLNGFGVWFSQSLVGVTADPTFPGLTTFNVRPAFGVGLESAGGTVWTPRGAVKVSWAVKTSGDRDSGVALNLNLTVPVNAKATVWIPAGEKSVMEGSGPASAAATYLRQDGDDSVWRVGSGTYVFTVLK